MASKTRYNRRELLRQGVGSLLAAGLWPGVLAAEGQGNPGAFHFLVVNDVHYRDSRCSRWLEKVIAQLKKHKEEIEFCLLAGDLSENGQREQLVAVREHFKAFGKPTHVIVGNHDYLTKSDRSAFETLFPGRINYRFEHCGWQFVGLDTTEGLRARNTWVSKATLRWLDEQTGKLDRKQPTVVFTHFPMGPLVIGRPWNATDVLVRFKEHNLQAVFSGHWHGFTERHLSGVSLTTDRCCSWWHRNHDGTREKGYFLCLAKDGKLNRRFVEVPLL